VSEDQLRVKVVYWQQKLAPLGLAHWEFDVVVLDEIEHEYKGEVRAQVRLSPMYDEGTIEFSRKHVDSPDLDYIIVHELLHAVCRDFDEAIHVLCPMVIPSVAVHFDQRIDHEEEGVIDRIARTIVNLATID
jgi:hypothetical protein